MDGSPTTAASPDASPTSAATAAPAHERDVVHLPLSAIKPNPHQPRRVFDADALARLAESIKNDGIMQPVVVRALASGNGQAEYELVVGERRCRAAELAGLTAVPAIIRDIDEKQSAEWAIIENLQREDLNPIERAQAFNALLDQFNLSHEQAAERVGVERSTITNYLRLLSLHQDVQDMVQRNLISTGHAKAIASLIDPAQQQHIANRVVRQELSVRKTELAVREMLKVSGQATTLQAEAPKRQSPHLSDLAQQISQQLGAKVFIKPGRRKGAGRLSIDFHSHEQFDHLLSRLGVQID